MGLQGLPTSPLKVNCTCWYPCLCSILHPFCQRYLLKPQMRSGLFAALESIYAGEQWAPLHAPPPCGPAAAQASRLLVSSRCPVLACLRSPSLPGQLPFPTPPSLLILPHFPGPAGVSPPVGSFLYWLEECYPQSPCPPGTSEWGHFFGKRVFADANN